MMRVTILTLSWKFGLLSDLRGGYALLPPRTNYRHSIEVRTQAKLGPAVDSYPVMRSSGGRIGTEAVLVVAVPHLLVGGGYPGGIHWRRLRDRRSVGFVQIHVMSDWML